jgi:hypothetical protein
MSGVLRLVASATRTIRAAVGHYYSLRTYEGRWVSADKQTDPSREPPRKSVPSLGGQAAIARTDAAPQICLLLWRLLICLLLRSLSLLRSGSVKARLGQLPSTLNIRVCSHRGPTEPAKIVVLRIIGCFRFLELPLVHRASRQRRDHEYEDGKTHRNPRMLVT